MSYNIEMQTSTKFWRDPYFWALFGVGVVIIFFRLGAKTLYSWDEAIYGQIAREFLGLHHWLVPQWQAVPWFEKPPLAVWLMAISFRTIGISEFAARLPAALASLATLSLTYVLAKRFVPRWVATGVGLILLTSYLYLYEARFATTDMLLLSFALASLWGFTKLLETKSPAWWLVVWASLGLATMTKNIAVAPAVIALGAATIISWRDIIKLGKTKWFVAGVTIFLLLVVPWHIYMYMVYGQPFVDQYVGYHILSRGHGLENNTSGPFDLYYPHTLLTKYWYPWVYLAIVSGVAWLLSIKKFAQRQNPLAVMLLVLPIATFGLYQLSGTKLFWYMLPLLPPLSVMIGWLWWDVWQHWRTVPTLLLFVGFAAAMHSTPWALIIVLLLVAAALATNRKLLRQLSLVALALCCLLSAVPQLRPLYQRSREFVEPIGQSLPATDQIEPILLYKTPIQGPAQIYYTGRVAILMSTQAELSQLLQAGYAKDQAYNALNPLAGQYAATFHGSNQVKLTRYAIVLSQADLADISSLGHFTQTGQVGNLLVGTIEPAQR